VCTEDGDTGGGSEAGSRSPHSIKQFDRVTPTHEEQQERETEDQFRFVENLNKQYADAMQQRKFMKMLQKPRQNSC